MFIDKSQIYRLFAKEEQGMKPILKQSKFSHSFHLAQVSRENKKELRVVRRKDWFKTLMKEALISYLNPSHLMRVRSHFTRVVY